MWRDVEHALRLMIRDWRFTCSAVATLALGVGANTVMFVVVNAVLLRPFPFKDPDRLVVLTATEKAGSLGTGVISGSRRSASPELHAGRGRDLRGPWPDLTAARDPESCGPEPYRPRCCRSWGFSRDWAATFSRPTMRHPGRPWRS